MLVLDKLMMEALDLLLMNKEELFWGGVVAV